MTGDCKGDVKDVWKILNKRARITYNVDKKMCLKRMQLSLKNMGSGGGGMGEMNDKNEDK